MEVKAGIDTGTRLTDTPAGPTWVHYACAILNLTFVALVLMKSLAYLIEGRWILRNAGDVRADYWRTYETGIPRTYEDEIKIGRPRPFTSRSDLDSSSVSSLTLFGYIFKTPVLVTIVALGSVAAAAFSPRFVSYLVTLSLTALSFLMLLTALLNRLVLGPLDRFNPDLGLGRLASGRVFYPDASPLGRYVLALLGTSTLGYTAVYVNLSHASNAFADEGHAIAPVRWLYFTVTTSSTVGFGDIHPTNDLGRAFVLVQLASVSVFLAWAVASFFGETLPPASKSTDT